MTYEEQLLAGYFEEIARLFAEVFCYRTHITDDEMKKLHERSEDIYDEWCREADEASSKPPQPPARPVLRLI